MRHRQLRSHIVTLSEPMLLKMCAQLDQPGLPFDANCKQLLQLGASAKERAALFMQHWQPAVVFTQEQLAQAFGLDQQHLPNLCNKLGLSFRPAIYWNELDQQFQAATHTVSANELAMLVLKDPAHVAQERQAFLRTAFSFTDAEGRVASDAALNAFREKFTPEFSRRFTLRSALLEQDLDIITQLLHHTLLQYSEANVRYVEYSVSANDLCKPWLWPFITAARLQRAKVAFKFLAMFRRDRVRLQSNLGWFDINELRGSEDGRLYLHEFVTHAGKDPQQPGCSAANPLVDLSPLDAPLQRLEALFVHNPVLAAQFVVGLDLAADERFAPFNPFVQDKFIQFVRARHAVNPRFGMRVHCGEMSVPAERVKKSPCEVALVEAHMRIMLADLLHLQRAGVPLRIGHGVALAHCLQERDKHAALFPELEQLKDIPVEINPTSNEQLLASPSGQAALACVAGTHAAQLLVQRGFRIVVCTDDDGLIYPVQHALTTADAAHPAERPLLKSVAAEYHKAFMQGWIKTEHLDTLASVGRQAAFVRFVS